VCKIFTHFYCDVSCWKFGRRIVMNTDLNIFLWIWIFVRIMCGRKRWNEGRFLYFETISLKIFNIFTKIMSFSNRFLDSGLLGPTPGVYPRVGVGIGVDRKTQPRIASVSKYQNTQTLSHIHTNYNKPQKCAYN